jgi:hypothetical protein
VNEVSIFGLELSLSFAPDSVSKIGQASLARFRGVMGGGFLVANIAAYSYYIYIRVYYLGEGTGKDLS